jgi:hypothetical protein
VAKNNGMPLKVRPTGLGSEIDKERQDYTVYIGKWAVDRVYDVQVQGSPEGLRWFWSFSQHGPMMRSGRVSAFEEGAVSGELGSVEGLGEAGRGALEACRTNFG